MCDFLELMESVKLEIKSIKTLKELDTFRIKYLGKKGYISSKMIQLRNVSLKKRKEISSILNRFKTNLKSNINEYKQELEKQTFCKVLEKDSIDVSLVGRRNSIGTLHPVTRMIDDIENFFLKLGFGIVRGQEIDDDYHNFDALNISKNHPSRTDHDTFWFDSNRLLRTQTSNMQIRSMIKMKLPIKIIVPGKVYRNDYDSTHTPMFHQIEGLVIDKNINFSNLKWIIELFLNYFFYKNINIRFRPSYFPFTFLSSEVDILGDNNKWLEILGCGMVHPNVLNNVNIDSEIYSGYAFGLGVERIVMLRYGISDIRIFFENDLKFLKQFK
ncbi:phenylalanine--tRNA ligase subunit alpha [Buchnera aphidicola]|uniref:Phenylalanine--tRNA ligase alpha subunit n=1 Tax=Buchnera aphidicola subsp. Melaphis rhois TaxID=118103 RepID=A0A4D6YAK3_BUCMH|nr:phenylalanine--tRNA ligase subunit alpha [Buchnera aphidicola (Melaphis rhois)]